MSKPTTALIVLVICALPVVALADWGPDDPNTKWVQEPDLCGWDVRLTTPTLLADDFRCVETGWIADIHFSASRRGDQVGQMCGIRLSFHQDVPVGDVLYGYLGKEAWAVGAWPRPVPGGTAVIREFQRGEP